MAIEELSAVVAPPTQPLEAGDQAAWQRVEARLGLRLPREYFDLASRYGSGTFKDWRGFGIDILNPFAADFFTRLAEICQSFGWHRGLWGRSGVPYGMFPDRPGWLPVGRTAGNTWLCWVTEGEPEGWPVLLISPKMSEFMPRPYFQQVRLPLTSLLARSLTGSLRSLLWDDVYREPESPPPVPVAFVPAQPPEPEAEQEDEGSPRLGQVKEHRPGFPRLEWFEPDPWGRPQGVRALLCRASLFSPGVPLTVLPAWWETELPRPLSQWRRVQLLNGQFGGPGGDAWYNLIPLTEKARLLYALQLGSLRMALFQGEFLEVVIRVEYGQDAVRRYPLRLLINVQPVPGTASVTRLQTEIHNAGAPGCPDWADSED